MGNLGCFSWESQLQQSHATQSTVHAGFLAFPLSTELQNELQDFQQAYVVSLHVSAQLIQRTFVGYTICT